MDKILESNSVGIAKLTTQEHKYYINLPCDDETKQLDPNVGPCVDPLSFLIYLLNNDSVIGMCILYNRTNWNIAGSIFSQIEFGIRIWGGHYRNKGYGAEAAGITCDYAFKYMDVYRVVLKVLSNNIRAIRAYEKAGFRRCEYQHISKYLFVWMSKYNQQM